MVLSFTDVGGIRFITTVSPLGPIANIRDSAGRLHPLTVDDIANISEFLAEAWLNLTSEEYSPVLITESGYQRDYGHPITKDVNADPEFNRGLDRLSALERDCE